jgi:hypothetical protein
MIMQACGETVSNAQHSLFWRAWIPLGLDRLAAAEASHPTSFFSPKAFAEPIRLIEQAWGEGFRPGCDVVFGISVTRLFPRAVSTRGDKLRLPRLEEHFLLRIQGRGPGKPPRLTNYVAWEGDQALLPEDKDGEVALGSLLEAVTASGAFPGAFPPEPVTHCVVRTGIGDVRCPRASARKDFFVDGGVFDNAPLGLTLRVARTGLEMTPSGARWRARPDLSLDVVPKSLVLEYISPFIATFPETAEERQPETFQSLLGITSQMGAAFLYAARSNNLLNVANDDPAIFDRLVIPDRHLPAASSPFMAFFGFLDSELRMFDFALGMYDAHRMVVARLGARLAGGGWKLALLPEDATDVDRKGPGWRRYDCLSAVVDRVDTAPAACSGDDLADFRRVLQTSVERLWDLCFNLPDESGASDADPLCRAARTGAPPLDVPEVGHLPGGAWQHRKGENETRFNVRLLAAHGFRFRDLGLHDGQGDKAPAVIRERLVALGDTVAAAQPGAEGPPLATAVRLLADTIVYVPPRVTLWLVYGSPPEVGVSTGLVIGDAVPTMIRAHFALQLNGVERVLATDRDGLEMTVLGGVEVLPSSFASTWLQPSLLLRGGWLLVSGDSGGTRACHAPQGAAVGSCSQPAAQVGLALTALERIRLQFIGTWYPPLRGAANHWAVGPGLGAQWAW